MSSLPPGVKFLSRGFAYVAVYVGGAIGVTRIVGALSDGRLYVPVWWVVTGALAAVPALSTIYILNGEWYKRRRAAALGARVMPTAPGKWLGNVDILKMSLRNLAIGYPGASLDIVCIMNDLTNERCTGDGLTEIVAQQGPVFNFRLLWSDIILTTCPEHIKAMLASDFGNYVKGESFHHTVSSVLGTGVFNSDGPSIPILCRPQFDLRASIFR